jgi:hypothetical protein
MCDRVEAKGCKGINKVDPTTVGTKEIGDAIIAAMKKL